MPADDSYSIYDEERRIIRQAMQEQRLVIFVGAGVSHSSGVPLWGSAIEKFASHLPQTLDSLKYDSLKIPQMYFNERKGKEYNELVKEIFEYDSKTPNELHKKILKFGTSTIVTTNYDNFLEIAAYEEGKFYDVISSDDDVPYSKNPAKIYKMHGCLKKNNFVLKEDDYLNYSENFRLIETCIKALFAQNVVLFIGYSFSDPDTKQIFNWLKTTLGEHSQSAYLINVSDEYNSIISDYYKNFNIKIMFAKIMDDEIGILDIKKIRTLKMMDFILNDKIENETEIERIYSKISAYNEFNSLLPKYVSKAFGANYYVEADFIRNIREKNNNILNELIQETKKQNKEHDKVQDKKIADIKLALNKAGVNATLINNKYEKISSNYLNLDSMESKAISEFSYNEIFAISSLNIYIANKEDMFNV